MPDKTVEASLNLNSGDPAEGVLRTILSECGTIEADRLIDLVAAAVDAWEVEASGSVSKFNRRGFDRGYHGGKAEAYRKIAGLLRMYQFLKKADSGRKGAKDDQQDDLRQN